MILRTLLCCTLLGLSLSAQSTRIQVPGTWESAGHQHNGIAWYECYVKVPDRWVSKGTRNLWVDSVTLKVSKVSAAHEVYINGKKVGSAGSFPPRFESGVDVASRYKIQPGILQKGAWNTIAFRIHDNGGEGGFLGEAPVISGYFLECVLAGEWEFRTNDDPSLGAARKEKPEHAAYDQFREAVTVIERPQQVLSGTGLSPEESHAKLKVWDDIQVDLVLAEPDIAQPLHMSFDERGRLWVAEYRQYPFPAGLKMLSRDKYYRATYDKIPPPPPHQDPGMDRVSIHEDTNGDGNFDKHTVFIDNLNLVTAVAHGNGGKWILNPPYLLFYPDVNQDDQPDADPAVHLAGFGLEDTHSVASNLSHGPDGWLYGAHGSTTSSKITRPGVSDDPIYMEGSAIWRYYPVTRQFEVFAEGGGNPFEVQFDSQGRTFAGTNGGNSRGYHYWEGGLYNKGNTGKYGPPSNPYTFGEMPSMAHARTPRFTHTFVVYEANILPKRYHGKMLCGDPLHRRVVLTERFQDGSTLRTEDLGFPLESDDPAFRPIDMVVGPDGAIYISDWYEQYIAHGQHFQGQVDPTNGRIYRIRAKDASPLKPFNLGALSSSDLLKQFRNPNKWYRQKAQQLLSHRSDQSILPELEKLAQGKDPQVALEAVWGIYNSGGLSDSLIEKVIESPHEHVRLWAIRLACDDGEITPTFASRLAHLATEDPSQIVRAQLAVSARQIPSEYALPIIRNLLNHNEDAKDPHLPMLTWLALEARSVSDSEAITEWFSKGEIWSLTMVREHILPKLMRRYATTGKRKDLLLCAQLLNHAPDSDSAQLLMKGFEQAFKSRTLPPLPAELTAAMAKVDSSSLALQIRRGDEQAMSKAIKIISDSKADPKHRLIYTQIFGEINHPASVSALLNVAAKEESPDLQKAALTSLQRYNESKIGQEINELYPSLSENVRPAAQVLLSSRTSWTHQFLDSIDSGKISKSTLGAEIVDKLRLQEDPKIQTWVSENFGKSKAANEKAMQEEVKRIETIIKTGNGNIYTGEKLYTALCASCHKLFHKGGQIGPDLTSYQRDDLSTMLTSIVNPNAEIREGFENYTLITHDGRILSGFLADQDANIVILRGFDGQNISLQRKEVRVLQPVGQSLMPANLLNALNDQQIRDLIAYLRTGQPISK